MLVVDNQEFPLLFCHTKRSEWGVGVLSERGEGRCSYLFEDGEERTLGAQGMQLLRQVERPSREQQVTWTHLLNLLAKRRGPREPRVLSADAAIEGQVERFRERFTSGFFGKPWNDQPGEATARRARQALVPKVQSLLSPERVAGAIAEQRIADVWHIAVTLLEESGMTSGSLPSPRGAEEQRQLAQAVVDLLHGTQSYERRFDRWVAAYVIAAGDGPSWQTATTLPALLSPVEHVYVDPQTFRKQLSSLGRPSTLGGRPSGVAYLRCLVAAQSLANLLAARGVIPRDLLDVHDFVRSTIVARRAELEK
ncbi:MAG: hypothetical protein K0R38_4082 [Polyangiaceae bacterium]|jgi:hypothetical protein|nr:hypothetical protein [Polyangiaceae bacterium]